MRAIVGLLPLLAACSETAPGDLLPPAAPIACALAGAAEFARDCTMERAEREGLSLVIIRHPDGAFRRLEVGVAGRGIVAADGADVAEVRMADGAAEVRLGEDRYRLPISQ